MQQILDGDRFGVFAELCFGVLRRQLDAGAGVSKRRARIFDAGEVAVGIVVRPIQQSRAMCEQQTHCQRAEARILFEVGLFDQGGDRRVEIDQALRSQREERLGRDRLPKPR